ncbi:MAG: MutS-related protein [Roseiflexaceae bacterium]
MNRTPAAPGSGSYAANNSISLLYPPSAAPPTGRGALDEGDLGLAPIVRALDVDGRHGRFVAGVLAELNDDPRVIAYRQDVLGDLLRLPQLAAAIGAALPQLAELAKIGRAPRWGERVPLLDVAARLAELDSYAGCVEQLGAALDERPAENKEQRTKNKEQRSDEQRTTDHGPRTSEGLLALRERLAAARADPAYCALAAELPALRAQLDRAGSVTLGINLDAQLRPESATVISVNAERFAGKGTLLERLFGERVAAEAIRGITALYTADDGRPHTHEHALFRDMSRLLEKVVQPVAAAIERYARLSSAWLVGLEPQLAFYLGAARLATDLRAAGLPLCRPQIAPAAERSCTIEASYSLELALRLRAAQGDASLAATIVHNDVHLGPGARIAIVTGPNSGGKTTYTRAIGQAQALFQAGLHIPGRAARISPADAIFTHFAAGERAELGRGRLAQELEWLAAIFRRAGPHSLLLLNEPLASTDQASGRALGRDLLAGLRLLGARTVFVTHLYQLVEDALALDAGEAEPLIVSLVAGAAAHDGNGAEPAPTYRIAPGQPRPPGYAAELARQYGLDAAQIAKLLRERGVVRDE